MKKIILTILIIFITSVSSLAQISVSDTLSAIENNILGYDYPQETEVKRLERIESVIYGEKRAGSVAKRIENLQNDTGFIVKKAEKEQKQVKEQIKKQNEAKDKSNSVAAPIMKEDSTVDYPMVDKLESEIFKTTYKNENIYDRIDRLEMKVFNNKSSEDLNTRVDKLASVVKPKNYKPSYENYNYSSEDLDNYYAQQSGLEPIDNQSMPFQLSALEQDLLNNSYMNDNIANRLSRLEQKLFNRTFKTDTDITRLQRVMVAYDAKRNSYKYENNRKMQNIASMSQLGGILLMILAILL